MTLTDEPTIVEDTTTGAYTVLDAHPGDLLRPARWTAGPEAFLALPPNQRLRATLAHVLAVAADGLWDQTCWAVSPELREATIGEWLARDSETRATYAEEPEPICGTAHCFGGWAVTLAGGSWHPSLSAVEYDSVVDPRSTRLVFPLLLQGLVAPHERARRLLGLSQGEAIELFAANNALSDLVAIVARLTA